jgi:3-deoxy-manno-octulosonate cytidylyltransferase (CMP-KDO synthetase)
VSNRVLVVIPARYAAQRLPGKPLLDRTGKPLIQHVWEQVRTARCDPRVVVATDDQRILEAVGAFGGEGIETATTHQSGTDRVAEVARIVQADIVVNWQGDEPDLPGSACDALVALFDDPAVEMATLATPCDDSVDLADPNVVKVVTDGAGDALYFSRAAIPLVRDGENPAGGAAARSHVGVYGFRREALFRFAGWPQAPLELTERLEQLRALHHGLRIRVGASPHPGGGIDTPEDYERFVERVRTSGTIAPGPTVEGEA